MIADAKNCISKYSIKIKADPNLFPHRTDKLNP